MMNSDSSYFILTNNGVAKVIVYVEGNAGFSSSVALLFQQKRPVGFTSNIHIYIFCAHYSFKRTGCSVHLYIFTVFLQHYGGNYSVKMT